jgi:hypothetical protein
LEITVKKLETQTQLQSINAIIGSLEMAREEALNLPCTAGKYVVYLADDALPFRTRRGEIALVGDAIFLADKALATNVAAKLQLEMDKGGTVDKGKRIKTAPILEWAQLRSRLLTPLINEWREKLFQLGREAAAAAGPKTLAPERVKQIHDNVRRIALEKSIVRALIAHMKRAGWSVFRINDGEELTYPKTIAEALDLIFNLDEASLRFVPTNKLPTGKRAQQTRHLTARHEHGVLLILGEGVDCINDWNYSDGDADGFNAAMDAFDVEKVKKPRVPQAHLDAAIARASR